MIKIICQEKTNINETKHIKKTILTFFMTLYKYNNAFIKRIHDNTYTLIAYLNMKNRRSQEA